MPHYGWAASLVAREAFGDAVLVKRDGADGRGSAGANIWSCGRPSTFPDLDPDAEDAILRRFGFDPDPVIEAYKRDVDRTLLRQNLKRSPEERWRNFATALALAEELRRAGACRRGR